MTKGRGAVDRGTGEAVPRITANKGRRLQQAAPSSRRTLFDAERKERFLGYFCGSANLSWAAREAGVNYRTVLRHRATDPAFGEAYDLAEAQSVPRLRAWLAEAAEETRQKLADAALGEGTDASGCPGDEEPGGDTAPARLSVEQTMQFLRDHEQSQARRERAARLGPGRGNGRPVSVASNEEVKAALVKALWAHGIRVRAGQGQSGEAPGPSSEGSAPVTPPPPSGWSPSPSGEGEAEQ